MVAAVKQTASPGVKGVQVVGQLPVTAAQKSNQKEGGGGTFRFMTHSDKYPHCLRNTRLLIVKDPKV